jgi:hypothetical protein
MARLWTLLRRRIVGIIFGTAQGGRTRVQPAAVSHRTTPLGATRVQAFAMTRVRPARDGARIREE